MSIIVERIDYLEEEGFWYINTMDVFFRLHDKKCFSIEYIEKNELDIIRKNVAKYLPPWCRGIVYYFNKKPNQHDRNYLDNELQNYLDIPIKV